MRRNLPILPFCYLCCIARSSNSCALSIICVFSCSSYYTAARRWSVRTVYPLITPSGDCSRCPNQTSRSGPLPPVEAEQCWRKRQRGGRVPTPKSQKYLFRVQTPFYNLSPLACVKRRLLGTYIQKGKMQSLPACLPSRPALTKDKNVAKKYPPLGA